MGDDGKLDLILDKLDDAAVARRDMNGKLEALAISTAAHYVEDKAFMTETRAEQLRIAERVQAIEARRDAETTQRLEQARIAERVRILEAQKDADTTNKLKALDEPKDTRLQLKRAGLAILLGAPITLLIGLAAAWFKHLLGW